MSAIDWLILAPAIPAIPIFVTWWLPWERIPWAKLPKAVVGPYALYLFFVAIMAVVARTGFLTTRN